MRWVEVSHFLLPKLYKISVKFNEYIETFLIILFHCAPNRVLKRLDFDYDRKRNSDFFWTLEPLILCSRRHGGTAQGGTSKSGPRVKRGGHAAYARSVSFRKWVTTTKPKCNSGRELKIETEQLAATGPITCLAKSKKKKKSKVKWSEVWSS